jgi:hypothetical protein
LYRRLQPSPKSANRIRPPLRFALLHRALPSKIGDLVERNGRLHHSRGRRPGCKTGNLVTYNPKAHPEFTDSTGILLICNVNALNSKDLVGANDYIPRFLRITIPGVTDTDASERIH